MYIQTYSEIMAFVSVVSICCLCVSAVSQHCAAQQNFAGYGALGHADRTYEPLLRQYAMKDENCMAPNASALIRHTNFSESKRVPIYQALPFMSRPPVTPPEVAKYRNVGNFYQAKPHISAARAESQIKRSQDNAVSARHHLLEPRPVIFEHSVLHVDQLPSLVDEYRWRRYANLIDPQSAPDETSKIGVHDFPTWKAPALNSTAKVTTKTNHLKKKVPLKEETRAFHDIYLQYADPHHLNFGHVESRPELFEKRFESLNSGSRYKGKVVWADATGGYGEHHWDMAHGKLR